MNLLIKFFLSCEVHFVSINLPYSLAWNTTVVSAGAHSYYLKMLDKLQKQVCWTVGPTLAASLEPLANCQTVANLSIFFKYYVGSCSIGLAELVPLFYSRGRYSRYSNRFHDFSLIIPRCYRDITATMCNSLLVSCFPKSYDLNNFNYRISVHLLILSNKHSYMLFIFIFFLFSVPYSGCSALFLHIYISILTFLEAYQKLVF